jgi:metal-responsive CopG/Arc/MetJ family transcriptional regulator
MMSDVESRMPAAYKSKLQTTTVRLPKRLYEEARSVVQKGSTEARSLNDFIVAAIKTYLKIYERKQIDAAFAGMAKDVEYQQEAKLLAKEFAYSDREALRLGDKDLNS